MSTFHKGLKKDVEDSRCKPFLHVLSLLEKSEVLPQMILVENVSGFEDSEAHELLTKTLRQRHYSYKEFLLTPSQFGIPNSRLRYYLIAKHCSDDSEIEVPQMMHRSLYVCVCFHDDIEAADENCPSCGKRILPTVSKFVQKTFSKYFLAREGSSGPLPPDQFNLSIRNFMEVPSNLQELLVKDSTLLKYSKVFDIVQSSSKGSCCFTKGYGHYVQGTGSIIQHDEDVNLDDVYKKLDELGLGDCFDVEDFIKIASRLKLRYFSPNEILKLMCFPEEFEIPPGCTNKQAYKALGNSINVFVVTLLLLLVFE